MLPVIEFGRAEKDGPPGRVAQTCCQGIVLTHAAQIPHQVERVTIAHCLCKTVGNRQGKPCALKQPAKVADFTHRHNARRKPTCNFGLGICQTSTQFMQRLPAKQKAHEKPIWSQRVAALNHLSDGVI